MSLVQYSLLSICGVRVILCFRHSGDRLNEQQTRCCLLVTLVQRLLLLLVIGAKCETQG
jgi:hypothetical protein